MEFGGLSASSSSVVTCTSCENDKHAQQFLLSLNASYRPQHIFSDLDNNITPEGRLELDQTKEAVLTELEWELRTLTED